MNTEGKTIKVHVSYMAQVKKMVGISSEDVEIDSKCTAQEMIQDQLCKKYPNMAEYILGKDGMIRPIILVFVGDDKLEVHIPRKLKNGDEITIMSPITGG